MGIAVLDYDKLTGATEYVYSTKWECVRGADTYQDYRLRLVKEYTENAEICFGFHAPDILINEILPVKGFNNSAQIFLAHAALGAVQGTAYALEIPVMQVSALTVKTRIGGTKKATKVGVRNGVLQVFPELLPKKYQLVADESDAIAIGLTHLGYDLRTP
ncbi:MAG: hypothetical protein JWR61_5833 [Ferruginibacter sp.]|nr:hypothetical protein [Ferruginibacter sp.]